MPAGARSPPHLHVVVTVVQLHYQQLVGLRVILHHQHLRNHQPRRLWAADSMPFMRRATACVRLLVASSTARYGTLP